MDTSNFAPRLGPIASEINLIHASILSHTSVRTPLGFRQRPPFPTPSPSASVTPNLHTLPTELHDQILSYLTASSAVAFKLTSRFLYATKPSLRSVLLNLNYNRHEAFLTKCYLEALPRPQKSCHLLCSSCKKSHVAHYFDARSRTLPAEQRTCYGASGFEFMGAKMYIPRDNGETSPRGGEEEKSQPVQEVPKKLRTWQLKKKAAAINRLAARTKDRQMDRQGAKHEVGVDALSTLLASTSMNDPARTLRLNMTEQERELVLKRTGGLVGVIGTFKRSLAIKRPRRWGKPVTKWRVISDVMARSDDDNLRDFSNPRSRRSPDGGQGGYCIQN